MNTLHKFSAEAEPIMITAELFYAVRECLYKRTPNTPGVPWDCGGCGRELDYGHEHGCVVGVFERTFNKKERPMMDRLPDIKTGAMVLGLFVIVAIVAALVLATS